MEQIRVENLQFSYGSKNILKSVNTQIEKGEIVALLGPNGSGKSTLMKCINKVLAHHKGNIWVEEKNVQEMTHREMAQKIAYVPQYEAKVSGVRVFDMVLSGRMPYITWQPSDNDYQRVSDVIEQLHLSELAMRDFGELSGGQQQMVYIARAIVQDTPIILLDEPINNLDLKHQVEIMKLLKSLSEQDKTIIITLHDINLALQYCQKYILLKLGEIFAQGEQSIINTQNLEQVYDLKMNILRTENSIFINPYLSH